MAAMQFVDLGLAPYREVWALQARTADEVLAGAPERVFLVEHPPVITLGRRPGGQEHILADQRALARRGIEVVHSDRGGDVTFHGPGQLVVYPILHLGRRGWMAGTYVRRLQELMVAVLAEWGIAGRLEPGAVGIWVEEGGRAAKICALGVRIRRQVSLHGLALNVTTDLRAFDLINPCGLGRPVSSLARLLGERTPAMAEVKAVVRREAERLVAEQNRPALDDGGHRRER
jgi:lipoyl(octanoyl) transferase